MTAKTITIHAFRRTAEAKFNDNIAGLVVKFAANAAGHVVAGVPAEREDVIDRLTVQIADHYKVYDGEEVSPEEIKVLTPADTEPPKPKFVIKTSDESGIVEVDLKAMDDAALKEFVKTAGITGIHHSTKGDKLRAAICKAVGQDDGTNTTAAPGPTAEELANQ